MDSGRTLRLVVGTVLATIACGRTPSDAGADRDLGTTSPDPAAGADATPGTGGKTGGGGTGGLGGIPDLGTNVIDWNASTGGSIGACETVARLPEDAVPVCTFTGSRGISYGCDDAKVVLLSDSTSYYFSLNFDPGIVRCPIGKSNPDIFERESTAGLTDAYSTLTGQMLANGLVRFRCSVHDHTGPGWSYRHTCSTSGVETIQPDAKSRAIYVDIKMASADSGATVYEGCLDARCEPGCEPRTLSFHVLGVDEEPPVWTSSVNFSADGLTFWFNDLDGRLIAMRINQNLEVLDIRR